MYPVFSCGLVVIISRFHREDPGSIPGRRILKEQTANLIILANYPTALCIAWLAQMAERMTVNHKATGSKPVPSAHSFCLFFL